MARSSLFYALLGVVASEPDIGFAFTRNAVLAGAGAADELLVERRLHNVVLAASSLRRHAGAPWRVCLFTDLPPSRVAAVAAKIAGDAGVAVGGDLFERILPDSGAKFAARSPAEAALLGDGGDHASVKARSRLGKILNLRRAPYALTLFVDDDTYFCDEPGALRAILAYLHETRALHPVRARLLVNRTADEHVLFHDARHCVWRAVEGEDKFSAALDAACVDAAAAEARFCGGAQSGALAVAAGEASRAFADRWADAYLAYWKSRSPVAGDAFASDQVTLQAAMRADCDGGVAARFGALPGALHVRSVQGAHRKPCDMPLFGPALMLHSKHLVNKGKISHGIDRLERECAGLNGPGGFAWQGSRRRGATAFQFKCTWMISGVLDGSDRLDATGEKLKKKRYQPPEPHPLVFPHRPGLDGEAPRQNATAALGRPSRRRDDRPPAPLSGTAARKRAREERAAARRDAAGT